MQAKKLLLGAMCTAFLGMVACTGLEPYKIEAPEDLSEKIAEYKAEKEAEQAVPDDAVEIELSPEVVGAEDNSSGWWTEFSQYFTIPVAKKLVLSFVNYGTGVNNWNNWNLALTTAFARGADGYAEYAVIRSDQYGWGGAYDGANIALDIDGEGPGDDSWWAAFREKMNGATVELVIDHASEGTAYVVETATALDGSIITETFHCPVSFVDDINVFLICDGSHFKMERAYLTNSEYPILPDSNPAGIILEGYPTAINYSANPEEIDYWGATTATVVFEDESTMKVDRENLDITAPELTTPGIKTVVVSYSYTKKGVLTKAATGYYNFELIAGLEGLEVAQQPAHNTYLYFENTKLDFRPYGIQLQAKYDGGTVVPLTMDDVTVSDILLQEGEQDVTLTYKPGSQAVTATTKVNLVKGAFALGVPELNSGWWTYFAPDVKVPVGESVSYEMDVYSVAAENWHSPVAILRKGNLELGAEGEYAVVRMDNFGWGSAFVNDDANKESDWNWDLFKPMQNNAHVVITATNNGDNAVIRYDVLWANGEEHYQVYKNIAISDANDVNLSVTVDNCYAVFAPSGYVEPSVPEVPVIQSIAVTKQPVTTTYLFDNNASLAFRTGGLEVTATYTDSSIEVLDLSKLNFSNIALTAGSQDVTISLKENAGISTTVAITLVKGTGYGEPDFSNAFFAAQTPNMPVVSGAQLVKEMDVYAAATLNYECPVFVLRDSANPAVEYGVCRLDNWCWDATGNPSTVIVRDCDWNFEGDGFYANINNMHLVVSVKNVGDGTAELHIQATYANGTLHNQHFTNIQVANVNDFQFAITSEHNYIVLAD